MPKAIGKWENETPQIKVLSRTITREKRREAMAKARSKKK